MGSFRQNASHADVKTPLLIIGGLLVALAILAIFQRQLRRRRRQKHYHPALELESSGLLGQIQRRKDDLNRFVAKLQSQLEVREQQLRLHDELEAVVTARVETSRQHDQEWDEIMRAGKKLHGKKWTQTKGEGQPSLKELMELHKDELLEIKQAASSSGTTSTSSSTRREKRMQAPSVAARRSPQVMQLPTQQQQQQQQQPRVVPPPQWHSTRRTAGSLAKPGLGKTPAHESETRGPNDITANRLVDPMNPWSMNNFQPSSHDPGIPQSPPLVTTTATSPVSASAAAVAPAVPKLNLSRLGISNNTTSQSPEKKKTKTFEQMFHRQAKLASTLNQKKKK